METPNSIKYLNIGGFLTLYIIVFVYLFQKKYEITSFILLSVFHGMFTLFVIQMMSTYNFTMMSYLTKSIWLVIFVGMVLGIVSLTFFISTYKFFDDKYAKRNIPMPFNDDTITMINNFKILFITNVGLIIMLLSFAIYKNEYLNKDPYEMIFKPVYIMAIVGLVEAAIIGISSYGIKMSNDFMLLKQYLA
jgi:hypothetical protein